MFGQSYGKKINKIIIPTYAYYNLGRYLIKSILVMFYKNPQNML